MVAKDGKNGFARALIRVLLAYVIFLQALGGAVAGTRHHGHDGAGLNALSILCTSDGGQGLATAGPSQELPNSGGNECCPWGCGCLPLGICPPVRGYATAWKQTPYQAFDFAPFDAAASPQRIAVLSPIRGPPPLQM